MRSCLKQNKNKTKKFPEKCRPERPRGEKTENTECVWGVLTDRLPARRDSKEDQGEEQGGSGRTKVRSREGVGGPR